MSAILEVGKGLLKLTWFMLKITAFVIDAVLNTPKKPTSPYSIYEVDELFDKGQISVEEYNNAFKSK
ncbi:hypothetical protein Lmor_0065 [Legionella moravica]|uniref:SHOCT domain-containing protein n=1 Tax=Legionella moravica TaxID=39962 RepID=A0A378LNU8_9GAMM|nr:hypothetical protein [Legionella moravica]KTD39699.1 hypothetical protein Lmor_0065 [Legionella moravica]STY27518.1 Uncharacterised protein [Legionella moravica]HAU1025045.1 hypothetical protein [Legionella pneumophila]